MDKCYPNFAKWISFNGSECKDWYK
ncbi:DUF4842 domain-containing protein [Bacteroides intestinalis]